MNGLITFEGAIEQTTEVITISPKAIRAVNKLITGLRELANLFGHSHYILYVEKIRRVLSCRNFFIKRKWRLR